MIFAGEFELERGVVLRRRLGRTRSQASVRNCVCTQLVCLHAGFAWNRRCFFFQQSHCRLIIVPEICTKMVYHHPLGLCNRHTERNQKNNDCLQC